MLNRCPNFQVDISARIAELGRQPFTARRFFLQYADRILFGTDVTPDVAYYRVHYRFLETEDEYFNYGISDPPSQGRWSIYGVNLPPNVLRKVYYENARRVLGLEKSSHPCEAANGNRALNEAHLPTLLNWLNRLPYEYGWDMDALRFRTIEDPAFPPRARCSWPRKRDGQLALPWASARDDHGWIKLMIVRPDRQRQGIGNRLLQELEARLTALASPTDTAGRCPLTYFTIGWDVRYTGAVAFLTKHGYQTTRRAGANMWVDLEGRDFGTREQGGQALARARHRHSARHACRPRGGHRAGEIAQHYLGHRGGPGLRS